MKKRNGVIVALTIAGLSTMPFVVRAAGAGQDQATCLTQVSGAVPVPSPDKVAQGELSAKQLLVLMDTDKNGKVSKQEFMAFLSAEFDRLDKNKDGELDVSELTKPRMRSVAGGHK
jgi:EF hand